MKRIAWVDIAKYISIMTVMLEHVESGSDELRCFLVPIFLPLFFFVSGYTHRAGQERGAFFKKKVRTLLVPWFIFGMFDILVSQLVSFQEHDLLTDLMCNFLQVRGFNGKLWFVAAIFVAYIPFYFFVEWYERKPSQPQSFRAGLFIAISQLLFWLSLLYTQVMDPMLLPWCATELPWHLDYMFIGMFYMFMGYLFRNKYEAAFDKLNIRAKRIMLLLFYSLLVYSPYFVDIPAGLFYFMAKLLVPVSGVFLTVAYSKLLPEWRYFTYIGENTLIVFGLHGKAMSFIEGILRRLIPAAYGLILSNTLASNLFAIVFITALSFVLIIPIYIINRWFPFVLGRSKQPKNAN